MKQFHMETLQWLLSLDVSWHLSGPCRETKSEGSCQPTETLQKGLTLMEVQIISKMFFGLEQNNHTFKYHSFKNSWKTM